ncbi:MAG: pre-peptidase C-terminal domain-containing protein [Gemmataceae bacterium]
MNRPTRFARRWIRDLFTTQTTNHRRLRVEPLEDRITPVADFAEPNNTLGTAMYLGRAGNLNFGGLNIESGDTDYISFRLDSTAGSGHTVGIDMASGSGDLDIELFNSSGTSLGTSAGTGSTERISLSGRAAGTYVLKIYGFNGATGNYSFVVQGPSFSGGDFLESNDTAGTAFATRNIVGGFNMNGMSIHSSTDVDWYRMQLLDTGTSASVAQINFTHANGDLDMTVYRADGTTVVGSSTGTSNSESVSLNGQPAGTYYVKVYGFNGATNSYSMTFNGPAAPSGDSFESNNTVATASNLGSLSAVSNYSNLSIHNASDVDFYRFTTANAGAANVSINFTHSVGDLDMVVYGSDGTTIVGSSGGTTNTESVNFTSAAGGTYYVKVYGYSSATGAYTMRISPPTGPAPDALEANNSAAAATDLGTVGSARRDSLSIHTATDEDWFKFTLASPGVTGNNVRITFTHASGDLDMVLFRADGTTVVGSSTGTSDAEEISLAGLAAGQYFLKVYGYAGARNGNYSLVVTGPTGPAPDAAETNNTQATATDLGTVGSASRSNLSIHNSTDQDWFKFTLPASGVTGNSVRIAFAHSAGDIDMQLLNSAGTVLASSSGTSDSEEISLAGYTAGTYFLKVYGYNGATNPNYSLTVNGPTPPSGPAADALEANNTSTTATNFGRVTGTVTRSNLSIHTTTDQDWFRFETVATGAAGHQVQIAFQHSLGDLDMVLYAADGTTQIGSSAGTGNTETISLSGKSAGVYFLKVYGYSGALNPNYSLTITSPTGSTISADRLEANDTVATATLLRSGTGTTLSGPRDETGLSITAGDVDYFKFTTVATGTAADSVSIAFLNGSGNLDLQLLASDGTTVLATSNGTSDTEVVSLNGRAAGTYYARVVGASGSVANNYDLRVRTPAGGTTNNQDAWTIMVYVTASNLQTFAASDINEMEAALAQLPGTVNITVFWDQSARYTAYSTDNGAQAAWGTAGRAVLTGDTNRSSVRTRFEILAEQNSGSAATLQNFIQWSAQNAPAQRYALMMWDHGGGIYGFNFDDSDNTTADNLTTPELVQAISGAGVNLSLVGFDACLMAMTEVAYSLRNSAPVFTGSQEVEDGPGHDYTTLLNVLRTQDPYQATPEALGTSIVQSFGAQYVGHGTSDTHSAIRSSAMDGLATALSNFVNAVGSTPSSAVLTALRSARNSAIAYEFEEFRDVGKFMTAVANNTALSSTIRNAATAVNTALAAAVISKTQDQRRSSGLSLYMPAAGATVRSDYASTYAAFNTATGWGTFARVLATGSAPARSVARPDWSEANDVVEQAYALGTISGADNTFSRLNLHLNSDVDWFAFTLNATGAAGNQVGVSADGGAAIAVTLFDANGTQIGSEGASVSLNGLAPGEYRIRVRTSGADPVNDYTLAVNAPSNRSVGDQYGDNSTADKAYHLGTVTADSLFAGMYLPAGQQDYFTFDVPVNINSPRYELVINDPAGAPVSAQIRDADGNVISSTRSVGTSLQFQVPSNASRLTLQVNGNPTSSAGYSLLFVPVTVASARLIGYPQFSVATGAGATQVRFFDPDGTQRSSQQVFPGLPGGVRTTSADFNGDGVAELVVGTGPGGPTFVRVFDGVSGQVIFETAPFEAAFVGGIYVSAGDVTGDGLADLVITPDEGGGPRVSIFSGGANFGLIANFYGIDDSNFRGGARAAIGDFNGDGVGDLVVAAGFGGGPRVAVFNGNSLTGTPTRLFGDFYIFEEALRNGAFVSAGDVNGDGFADIIGGGGPGGGPRVYILSGADLLAGRGANSNVLANFFAGNTESRGGVRVAAKNLDGDNMADLLVGDGTGAGSHVTTYLGADLATGIARPDLSFDAFPGFNGGVFVG